MDQLITGVDSVSLELMEDGCLMLMMCSIGANDPLIEIVLKTGDTSARHPIVLVGRGVEVAWVRGLNVGEDDSDPRCDHSTTVARNEDDGVLRLQHGNGPWHETDEELDHGRTI